MSAGPDRIPNCPRTTLYDAIEDEFGYDVTVVIGTREELADVVTPQPFDIPGADGTNYYVTFLNEEPADKQAEALLAAQTDAESFAVNGRALYSELDRDTLGDGHFADAGKTLGMEATQLGRGDGRTRTERVNRRTKRTPRRNRCRSTYRQGSSDTPPKI